MTNGRKKVMLERVLCIHYPFQFQKDQEQIKVLLDNNGKINTMTPDYIKKLGFETRKTNVGAQKIDGSTLETFKMVITNF